MAGMGGGMGAGTTGSWIDVGIQGAQNTSKQEYNQRQALYQNLVQATDDSAWLNAHFPNLFSWTPSGSGGGGYQPGSNAPQAYAGNPIKSDFAGAMGSDADRKQKQPSMDADARNKNAQAAYNEYLGKQGGGSGGGSYSNLWSD
jgi:hypothetical protein